VNDMKSIFISYLNNILLQFFFLVLLKSCCAVGSVKILGYNLHKLLIPSCVNSLKPETHPNNI
jgi:hypothetical protein